MNSVCKDFVKYIVEDAPKHNKANLEEAASYKYKFIKDRKVYHNQYFAVRFSYSKSYSESFSNTVLYLSALEKYDKIPFFVVLDLTSGGNLLLIGNRSLLLILYHYEENRTEN